MTKMTLQELTHVVTEIRDNHLAHMKEDMDKMDKKMEKMDSRVWAILILLVASIVIPAAVTFIKGSF